MSKNFLGSKHPNYKTGKYVHKGYIYIHKANRDRYNHTGIGWDKYGYEHRLVMEESLGRKLKSGEYVHHANGNKKDNRIENLVLVTRTTHDKLHRGQFICPYCNKSFIATSQIARR